MKRRLEPELMEDGDQARAYAQADFSESDALFLRLLGALDPGDLAGYRMLDLGCGPCGLLIHILKHYPRARCEALEGAPAMLAQARAQLARWPGIARRCHLIQATLPSETLPRAAYDLVLANSLLHHLADPQVLWRTLKTVVKPCGGVLVMDLLRPPSAQWAEALVATYAGEEPAILQRDFRNSLFAAFTPREVMAQLRDAGLAQLEVGVVSDRHLAVWGRMP